MIHPVKNLAPFEMSGRKKANFGGFAECLDSLATTGIQSFERPLSTAPLISSSSSASCEESCSSSSNDLDQTYLNSASESHIASSLSPFCHRDTRTSARKRKFDNHDDDPLCASIHSHRRNILGMDWDDSNWSLSSSTLLSADEKQGIEAAGVSSPTTTTTGHTIVTPVACSLRKHTKVQGLTFATIRCLHSEEMVWDDTNWKLPNSACATKKRKRTRVLMLSNESEICNAHPEPESSKTDHSEQQTCPSHRTIMPNLETGITKLLQEQHLNGCDLPTDDSPYTLYRWLRVRLASGLVRSSFDFLHRRLKKYYGEVDEIVRNLKQDVIHKDERESLVNLRDRLASTWCVYAHFTLEVGCLVFAAAREREGSSRMKTPNRDNIVYFGLCRENKEILDTVYVDDKNGCDCHSGSNLSYTSSFEDENFDNASSGNVVERCPAPIQETPRVFHSPLEEKDVIADVQIDDYLNHAISILLMARDCPLVGNHSAIGISLGRMIVSSTVMKESKTNRTQFELSRETLSANIQLAIAVCWDSIDVCRCNRRTKRRYMNRPASGTAIRSFCNFELKCDRSKWEIEARTDVHEGIKSTLLLPGTLRKLLSSTMFASQRMIINDKDTIRCLCEELNRWSRFGEEVGVDSHHTMRIRPSCDSGKSFAVEQLPLFASLETLSDPLGHYKAVGIPRKGIIWQW